MYNHIKQEYWYHGKIIRQTSGIYGAGANGLY